MKKTPPLSRPFRDALGEDISIRLDPAWAWTPHEALIQTHKLEELDLVWLEEPIWPPEDYRSLAALARNARIPFSGRRKLHQCDGFSTSLGKLVLPRFSNQASPKLEASQKL